ncbi:ROK family protein [Corynebacterium crudilactis]|uniref:Glucokinase n=1 Tax=Corynebacterium crudilactis TaxID=1652495 RepID=A0A172QVV0_9CORY|nr:ROK family protein [Corynebacterium crudilactis]ANE04834.1 hypothetical protein ccrud_11940 [Corynebacterium crudilactis]
MTAHTCTLALDIGGTKIAYALVPDDAPTTTAASGRLGTKDGHNPASQTRLAFQAGADAAKQHNMTIARIGVGAPGVIIAPEGKIVYNGETVREWAGTDLRAMAQEIIPVPFAAHNDVRVWAYGEHHMGAGESLTGRVLYVSLGTGIGGAIIDQGALLDSPSGTAGEFAEIVCADFSGRATRCEDVASGTGLTAYYNKATGENLKLPSIMQKYHEGDTLAQEIIEGNLHGFGRALGALVTLLDLDAVVVGGGVSAIGEPILHPLCKGIKETVLPPRASIQMLTTALGPEAAVLAAAQYARDMAF